LEFTLIFLLEFGMLLEPADTGVVLFDSAWNLVVPREHGASDVAVGIAGIAVRLWKV